MSKIYLPEQKEGNQSDAESKRCFDSEKQASEALIFLVQKLKTIHQWQDISKDISAEFYLTNQSGHLVTHPPAHDFYIRIEIPGPGNPSGDGYDWVKIIAIQDHLDEEAPCYGITVTPDSNPTEEDTHAAHFYETQATNTFVVRQEGSCVFVGVHGRNEKANVTSGPIADRARNALIGLGGIFGLGKVQWEVFTDGMIASIPDSILSSR